MTYGTIFTQKTINQFLNLRQMFSIHQLLKCNNTAILVYEPQIWEYETILRRFGRRKISVGKEVLIGNKIGIQPYGWLPDFIRKRFRAVESSGIMDWWNKFVSIHLIKIRSSSDRFQRERGIENVTKVSSASDEHRGIAGNICIVFVIFLIWLLFAIVSWFIEKGVYYIHG